MQDFWQKKDSRRSLLSLKIRTTLLHQSCSQYCSAYFSHYFFSYLESYLEIETIIAAIPTTTSNDSARAILPPRTMNTISSGRQTRVRKTFQALHANLMIHSRQSKSPKTHIVKITNNVVNIVITSYFLDLHHSSNAMSSFFSWTCI